jgi:hypothetical protein
VQQRWSKGHSSDYFITVLLLGEEGLIFQTLDGRSLGLWPEVIGIAQHFPASAKKKYEKFNGN